MKVKRFNCWRFFLLVFSFLPICVCVVTLFPLIDGAWFTIQSVPLTAAWACATWPNSANKKLCCHNNNNNINLRPIRCRWTTDTAVTWTTHRRIQSLARALVIQLIGNSFHGARYHHLKQMYLVFNNMISCFFLFFFCHQCSLTCGGGVQTRKAHCVDLNGRVIADSNCPIEERVLRQSCHMESCPRWEVGEWTPVNHIVSFLFSNVTCYVDWCCFSV